MPEKARQLLQELLQRRRLPALVIGALLLAAPFLPLPAQPLNRLNQALLLCVIMAVIALGLNVVTGLTGLLDLGVVAFVSVGAYTALILYDRQWMQFPFSFLVVLLIGGLHAGVWGVLRGAPTLRLSGDYYAIVTFAFAEILRIFIRSEGWLTGGGSGFKNFPSVNLWGAKLVDGQYEGVLKTQGYWEYPNGFWAADSPQFYYLCLFFLAAAMLIVWRLERSRTGRAWLAMKADETSAMTSGIHLANYKMIAFAVSAFIAGVGGALFGFRTAVVSTNVFSAWFSVVVLCGVVLGGMGSIRGVIAGTFIVYGLAEALREVGRLTGFQYADRARFLLFGALLVAVMVFKPQGLFARSGKRKAKAVDSGEQSPLYQLPESQ